MFKNYIWDFDGTLYNTYPKIVDAAEKALQELGVDASKDHLYRLMKQYSTKQFVVEFGIDYLDFAERFHRYEEENPRISKPFSDTPAVVQQLHAVGAKQFILTHRLKTSTQQLLQHELLLSYFEDIVAEDSGFPRKPDPASIHYLLATYQLNSEETVIVGDRKLDMDAGINAGIRTCLLDLDDFLEDVSANFTIHTLSDLLTL